MVDKKNTRLSNVVVNQDSANNFSALRPAAVTGRYEEKSANGLQELRPQAILAGNNANGLAAMAPRTVSQSSSSNPGTSPIKSK